MLDAPFPIPQGFTVGPDGLPQRPERERTPMLRPDFNALGPRPAGAVGFQGFNSPMAARSPLLGQNPGVGAPGVGAGPQGPYSPMFSQAASGFQTDPRFANAYALWQRHNALRALRAQNQPAPIG